MKPIEELLEEFGGKSSDVLLLIRETAGMVTYYRRLLERLELDALTGLPGANKFRGFIDNIESRAASTGVIFFDVNDLKYYNDNKGHDAGDLLIQKAAESIHLAGCGNTHVFRIGGDEFVAVLINCSEEDIDAFLEKWREKLTELNCADDGIRCSMAAGAAFASGDYKISDVLKLADERMYAEKRKMKAESTAPEGTAQNGNAPGGTAQNGTAPEGTAQNGTASGGKQP